MSIKWLAVSKNNLTDVSYCPIDSPIWHNTNRVREGALPYILWIPHKKHKKQALLLLSLGMTKEDIEQTLKESE